MPKSFLAKLGVFILALAITGTLAGVASACTNTRTDNHQFYFDGNSYPNQGYGSVCVFGTDTYIYVTDPSVPAPDWASKSFSAAWTGLQFVDAHGNATLSQTGWAKNHDGSRFNWVTFNTGGANFDETDWTAPTVGSEPDYKVTYTYSNNTFHYFYNGANNYNVQYPNGQLGCDYNTENVNIGEIDTLHNQMPGTLNNQQQFDDEEVMNNGGTWTYPTGPSNWTTTNTNNTYFYLAQGAVSIGGFTAEYANIYDKCNG
jgi:hypothetical protein